ncbi:MAG: C4-dicarboxylate ABC transporter [Muribaculaceae bacterium]|nr:C4-dicarboxylate ABC transporter [Muribaculaceae bacterium]
MKRSASIEDFLKPLREKPYQAYLSNALQVADVLDWVLQQLGKSEVWQTSFSISEEFIRRLYFIEKSGLVTRFNLVLDHKATNKTLKLWAFITQVITTTYLADNHSKVLLVRSERGEVVSIITSQNLTRGNRSESAVVTTDPELFITLHTQIEDLIRNHSVPLNDLFAQKLTL